MEKTKLTELQNIGRSIEKQLNDLGIYSHADLDMVGSTTIYRWLAEHTPQKRVPVCYYLYSLEGALQDRHWHDFSAQEKRELRLAAGLKG